MTKKSRFARVLDTIEVVGNRLPHPATLFFMMAALVALLSWWASAAGLQALHPATGEIIKVRNLLDADGIRWIYTNVEHNFVEFPPLGLVLVDQHAAQERIYFEEYMDMLEKGQTFDSQISYQFMC